MYLRDLRFLNTSLVEHVCRAWQKVKVWILFFCTHANAILCSFYRAKRSVSCPSVRLYRCWIVITFIGILQK